MQRQVNSVTRQSSFDANELRLRSIALPALGTGVGGFSLRECAGIMLDRVARHAATPTTLELVEFVLFRRNAYQAFADVIGGE